MGFQVFLWLRPWTGLLELRQVGKTARGLKPQSVSSKAGRVSKKMSRGGKRNSNFYPSLMLNFVYELSK